MILLVWLGGYNEVFEYFLQFPMLLQAIHSLIQVLLGLFDFQFSMIVGIITTLPFILISLLLIEICLLLQLPIINLCLADVIICLMCIWLILRFIHWCHLY